MKSTNTSTENDLNDMQNLEQRLADIEELEALDQDEFSAEIECEDTVPDPWAVCGLKKDEPRLTAPLIVSHPDTHRVKQGETLFYLAELYGMSWDRIWDDDQNKALRKEREAHLLFPGDKVYIPERRHRTEAISTEQRHRFRRKIHKVWLRIVFKDEAGQPRKAVKYRLDVEQESTPYEGKTTAEGLLEVEIPASVQRARLLLQPEGTQPEKFEVYDLFIQCLDPVDTLSGAYARLNNLGLLIGTADDATSQVINAAISAFQIQNGLPASSVLDDDTQKAFRKQYGT